MDDKTRARIDTLAFDVFGTVFDLGGSIVPLIEPFLQRRRAEIDGSGFWALWRDRQRVEQYQDTIVMLGHGGYREVARRALVYTLRRLGLAFDQRDVRGLMASFDRLRPFDDASRGLNRLAARYRLALLSNGDAPLVERLAESSIPAPFSAVLSVDAVGRFKPHPSVYRYAAKTLEREPGQIMMVSAHAFDIMGARACGFRGAYVNRYGLPQEDSPLQPDLTVSDFIELADVMLG